MGEPFSTATKKPPDENWPMNKYLEGNAHPQSCRDEHFPLLSRSDARMDNENPSNSAPNYASCEDTRESQQPRKVLPAKSLLYFPRIAGTHSLKAAAKSL